MERVFQARINISNIQPLAKDTLLSNLDVGEQYGVNRKGHPSKYRRF
jgi:hypothetical protein